MVGSYMDDKLLVADALTLAPRAPLLVMTGNGGADTFTLEATGRHIVVTDFNVAEGDKIVFGKSTGIKDVWQLQSNGWFDDGGFHIIVETPGLQDGILLHGHRFRGSIEGLQRRSAHFLRCKAHSGRDWLPECACLLSRGLVAGARRNRSCEGELAGAPGFEPGNGGTKNRCLTAWRRPNRAAA